MPHKVQFLHNLNKQTQTALATHTESVNNSLVLIIRIGYTSKHYSKNKKHIAVFIQGHIFPVWLWILKWTKMPSSLFLLLPVRGLPSCRHVERRIWGLCGQQMTHFVPWRSHRWSLLFFFFLSTKRHSDCVAVQRKTCTHSCMRGRLSKLANITAQPKSRSLSLMSKCMLPSLI